MTAQEFKEKAAAPAEEKKPLGSFLPKSAAPATKNVIRDSVPAMAQRPHSAETVYVRDVAEPEEPIVTSSPLTGRTYEITPPVKAEALTENPSNRRQSQYRKHRRRRPSPCRRSRSSRLWSR